ncbi:MAG: gliding motility-associated C-terminal domain-containing protein [Saprospirales bacterium]|nr:gliding motility-associated C-terminal domain-containing protein [Saprospirales bacterium]
MPFLLRFSLILGFLALLAVQAKATHNRAGEISIVPLGSCDEYAIEATITTYTKASSVAADRDSLLICWGDGTCQMVGRSNGGGQGQLLPNDTKLNYYIATHKYSGRSRYVISMTDPNRNGGILNVNPPNSENVPFHLHTTYTFPNCAFDGPNHTPTLTQPPIDIGCVGQPFLHNPNAVDIDNDSLSYSLVVPFQEVGVPVPNYLWPDYIEPGADNKYSLNTLTGDFLWESPQKAGEYNIAMYIISWRNGIAIDTVLRDMQILILDCDDNRPPVIEAPEYICVVAGETIQFQVIATDPDEGQKLELSALGGPFLTPYSPATFSAPGNFQTPPVSATFKWVTSCEHISDQPYTVVFRALDNYLGNYGLATLKTLRIKVVGPPPEDLQAEASSNRIELSWAKPYACEDAAEGYFYAFSVWRREGTNPFPPDTCDPGLEGKGYTRIFANTTQVVNSRYYFEDKNVERGKTYCYRILAGFAKTTAIGLPYNRVESLPSEEICIQLSRDVPLLTNVDVKVTDPGNGEIEVRWTKPAAEDLDTLQNPGPYIYEVWRADGITNSGFAPIGVSFTSPTFWQANDTSFIDTGLNTLERGYTYQIALYVNGEPEPIGFSPSASSVFLSIASSDEINTLSWSFSVSWNNNEYTIFKQNALMNWDSLTTTTERMFTDEGLVNGREYCYYVRSNGSYGIPTIASPLLNNSQIACGIPLDTIPPCPPILTVDNICDEATSCVETELINYLSWTNPMTTCPETDDVVAYYIYYAPLEGEAFRLIDSVLNSQNTAYEHQPESGLAGCYAVTARDTFFNESAFSNIVCVDNCPIYELPNAFTPNGDGQNDLYTPYPYCFIDRIDLKIFNRWGDLIFETQNADINWNGTDQNGKKLPDGTYYYTCEVFEQRVTGVIARPELLSGFIQLSGGQ